MLCMLKPSWRRAGWNAKPQGTVCRELVRVSALIPHLPSATEPWVHLIPGKEITPNSSDSVSARTQDRSHTDAATTRAGPRPFILVPFPTSSFPNPSPLSTPLDMDAFSVISDFSDKASLPEEPSSTNPCDHYVTQISTNPTSYLASLVKQIISLSAARRSLEEEILKSLEKREKLYLDAVESAKISLEMTRRDAVDIVKRLKDASGDIINIILPWQHEVEKEAYDTEKKPRSPTASPSTVFPAMPVSACPAHVPPPVVLAPEPKLGTSLPPAARSTPIIDSRIPASAMPPPSPNVHEPQELLRRYEERMNAAKCTANGALSASRIPWPVLISQFPLKPADSSLSAAVFQANLQDFINSYSQWKQLSFEETSAVMLSDWTLILSKLELKGSKGAQDTIDRVLGHLRTIEPRIPAKPCTDPNVHEHQELLQRYERKMNAAKYIANGTLKSSMIPWPILIHQYPLEPTDSSLGATVLQANLQDFINSYSRWKQLSIEETSTVILSGCVLILSKLRLKGSAAARAIIDRVISQLRTFSE